MEGGYARHSAGLLTCAAGRVNDSGVDLDDLFPSKPGDPLVELAKQDLDPMSIEELHARIEALKAEIARVEAHMDARARPPLRGRRAVQEDSMTQRAAIQPPNSSAGAIIC